MSLVTGQIESAEFLKQRGWRELPVSHAWRFQKPPLPAQYRLEDAIALEMSRAKARKGKP
jgi:hypothetical protein